MLTYKFLIERIEKAVEAKEKILIYGDYDVDGVTASTVMEQTLLLAGIKPENIEIMMEKNGTFCTNAIYNPSFRSFAEISSKSRVWYL